MGIGYSFCLTEFLPVFGESPCYEAWWRQVPPPIYLFHLPLQLKHEHQSVFHQSDIPPLDFDASINDAQNQKPCGSLSLEAEVATSQIRFVAKQLGPLES